MGFVLPGHEDDGEEPGPGRSLDLDLDVRACPVCRRELLPWQEVCPDDGAEAVAKTDLPPADGPPVPGHLLDDAEDTTDRDEE